MTAPKVKESGTTRPGGCPCGLFTIPASRLYFWTTCWPARIMMGVVQTCRASARRLYRALPPPPLEGWQEGAVQHHTSCIAKRWDVSNYMHVHAVCVYMNIHMNICIHVRIYVCMHAQCVHTYVQPYIHTHPCEHNNTYIHIHVSMNKNPWVCTHAYVRMYIRTWTVHWVQYCTYVHTYVYVHFVQNSGFITQCTYIHTWCR